jgi:hypothetical protein
MTRNPDNLSWTAFQAGVEVTNNTGRFSSISIKGDKLATGRLGSIRTIISLYPVGARNMCFVPFGTVLLPVYNRGEVLSMGIYGIRLTSRE